MNSVINHSYPRRIKAAADVPQSSILRFRPNSHIGRKPTTECSVTVCSHPQAYMWRTQYQIANIWLSTWQTCRSTSLIRSVSELGCKADDERKPQSLWLGALSITLHVNIMFDVRVSMTWNLEAPDVRKNTSRGKRYPWIMQIHVWLPSLWPALRFTDCWRRKAGVQQVVARLRASNLNPPVIKSIELGIYNIVYYIIASNF